MTERRLRARERSELWGLLPSAMTLGLVLAETVPMGVPHLTGAGPLLTVTSVYYWTIYRPDFMPAPLAFVVGIATDTLSGGPVGLMALVLVAMHGFCTARRPTLAGLGFAVGWAGFLVVALGAMTLAWLTASLYFLTLIDPRPIILQVVVAAALYPALIWTFGQAERLLPSRDRL
jgi:rod shape-determining protein MreD